MAHMMAHWSHESWSECATMRAIMPGFAWMCDRSAVLDGYPHMQRASLLRGSARPTRTLVDNPCTENPGSADSFDDLVDQRRQRGLGVAVRQPVEQ